MRWAQGREETPELYSNVVSAQTLVRTYPNGYLRIYHHHLIAITPHGTGLSCANRKMMVAAVLVLLLVSDHPRISVL